jgi:hypothetical protein
MGVNEQYCHAFQLDDEVELRNERPHLPLSHAMRMERMNAFVALDCDTPVEVDVERLGAGAGKVRCFACGGSGLSPLGREFQPDPLCAASKGSGHVLVSV